MPTPTKPPPTVQLDLEAYRPYLDDPDLSTADQDLMIQTLWEIMCRFVRLGYAVEPVHHLEDAKALRSAHKLSCGKFAESQSDRPEAAPDALYLTHQKAAVGDIPSDSPITTSEGCDG